MKVQRRCKTDYQHSHASDARRLYAQRNAVIVQWATGDPFPETRGQNGQRNQKWDYVVLACTKSGRWLSLSLLGFLGSTLAVRRNIASALVKLILFGWSLTPDSFSSFKSFSFKAPWITAQRKFYSLERQKLVMVALFTEFQFGLSLLVMIRAGGVPAVIVADENHWKLPGLNGSIPPSLRVISRE